jgi:hypothetical protein
VAKRATGQGARHREAGAGTDVRRRHQRCPRTRLRQSALVAHAPAADLSCGPIRDAADGPRAGTSHGTSFEAVASLIAAFLAKVARSPTCMCPRRIALLQQRGRPRLIRLRIPRGAPPEAEGLEAVK